VFDTVPETADQVTAELKLPVPETVAEHWVVWPGWRLAAAQETVTDVIVGAVGAVIAIFAEPSFVGSSVEIALTLSEPDVGTVDGEVYRPEVETVPEAADQVTFELKVPVPETVAEHWLVCPAWRLVAAQETVTAVMVGEGGGVLPATLPLTPQPARDRDPRSDRGIDRLSKVLHLIALVLTHGLGCPALMG
jgi:hypothetical protein